ncbi:hypothetical protein [Roseiconus lacunae]|uniref:hypothetical protein n=1 Tax=Roseiconus lacunae TaxID=2605694 RepID=UPI0011F37F17|nr:hypothetical protein [Roseiconus lacunae]
METNPYQPPSTGVDDALGGDQADEVTPPRYRGTITTIVGSIDQYEAIEVSRKCRPATAPGQDAAPPNSKFNGWGVGISSIVAALLFFMMDMPSSLLSSLAFFSPSMIVSVVVITTIFVLLLFTLTSLHSRRFSLADPPLGGLTTIHLNRLGYSVEKKTFDGRLVEVFCSWRQTQVFVSEKAWLLNMNYSSPVLILRDWIDDANERTVFDALINEVARWQAAQPIAHDIEVVTPEASESFPDYANGAVTLVVSTQAEQKTRRKLRRKLQARLPEFRVRPVNSPLMGFAIGLWRLFLVALAVSTVWTVADHWWIHFGQGYRRLVTFLAPQVMLLAISLWLTMKVARPVEVAAAISSKDLWFDHRSLLIRIPLATLKHRWKIEKALVLATENGATTLVLPRESFASGADFDRAAEWIESDERQGTDAGEKD